jgi:hypothetical protein
VKQEVGDLFEGGVGCQVVNVVAAIEEDALLTIDEARLRRIQDYVLKSAGESVVHCVLRK